MLLRASILISVLSCLLFTPQEAAAWKFGSQQDIHFLQDIKLKGAKDEALYLGYMTKTQFFLAGL